MAKSFFPYFLWFTFCSLTLTDAGTMCPLVNLNVISSDNTSMTILWTKAERESGIPKGYLVKYWPYKNENEFKAIIIFMSGNNEGRGPDIGSKCNLVNKETWEILLNFIMQTLKPDQDYTIKNSFFSNEMLSSDADEVGTTKEGESSVVKNLKVELVESSVEISYDRPSNENGRIQHYNIKIFSIRKKLCKNKTYLLDTFIAKQNPQYINSLIFETCSEYLIKVYPFNKYELGTKASVSYFHALGGCSTVSSAILAIAAVIMMVIGALLIFRKYYELKPKGDSKTDSTTEVVDGTRSDIPATVNVVTSATVDSPTVPVPIAISEVPAKVKVVTPTKEPMKVQVHIYDPDIPTEFSGSSSSNEDNRNTLIERMRWIALVNNNQDLLMEIQTGINENRSGNQNAKPVFNRRFYEDEKPSENQFLISLKVLTPSVLTLKSDVVKNRMWNIRRHENNPDDTDKIYELAFDTFRRLQNVINDYDAHQQFYGQIEDYYAESYMISFDKIKEYLSNIETCLAEKDKNNIGSWDDNSGFDVPCLISKIYFGYFHNDPMTPMARGAFFCEESEPNGNAHWITLPAHRGQLGNEVHNGLNDMMAHILKVLLLIHGGKWSRYGKAVMSHLNTSW